MASYTKALLPNWGEGHYCWTKRRVHPSPLGRVEGAIYRATSQEINCLYLWVTYQFFGARGSSALACELEREPFGFSSALTDLTNLTNPTGGTPKQPYHSERSVPIPDLVQFLSCYLPPSLKFEQDKPLGSHLKKFEYRVKPRLLR